jgi:hypothetical protein
MTDSTQSKNSTRNFLLTWYGITDLKAALGFEPYGGPILGALKTRSYTDVMVLAYTDPAKSNQLHAHQEQYLCARTRSPTANMPTPDDEMTAVDLFSNTPSGHQLYQGWLRAQIGRLGLNTNIRLCVKELEALNDSKGIYDAACQALEIVYSCPGDKAVTFYLSPGTPIMAFTWAFVALSNPELNINVIACPDYRNPPENIQLPYQLMAPSNRNFRRATGIDKHFDVVFHLFGEQRLPCLFGILQFSAKQHVFVTSPKYPADIMRKVVPVDAKFDQLLVNPFDPMSAKVAILKSVAQLAIGTRVGFNLTGGTKLMFAGAIAACRKIGGIPFYFETKDHNLVFLHDFSMIEMRGVNNLEEFFKLNGFTVRNSGFWEDNPARNGRIDFTNYLWKERSAVSKIYRELTEIMDKDRLQDIPFRVCKGKIIATLDDTGRAYFRMGSKEFSFKRFENFAKYLCGGWLEEYVYKLLEPMKVSGIIRDMRIGLEIAWEAGDSRDSTDVAQEFDVCFTSGKRLFIIECKAGRVAAESVHKLQTCVRNYGGSEAKGILATAFPPREPIRMRMQTIRNLSWIEGGCISKLQMS